MLSLPISVAQFNLNRIPRVKDQRGWIWYWKRKILVLARWKRKPETDVWTRLLCCVAKSREIFLSTIQGYNILIPGIAKSVFGILFVSGWNEQIKILDFEGKRRCYMAKRIVQGHMLIKVCCFSISPYDPEYI